MGVQDLNPLVQVGEVDEIPGGEIVIPCVASADFGLVETYCT